MHTPFIALLLGISFAAPADDSVRPIGTAFITTTSMGPAVAPLAHPLGNRIYDRSIQVIVAPDELRIEYELGVSELTIITELLELLERGQMPVDPVQAIEKYRDLLTPIIGRGLVLTVDDKELALLPAKAQFLRRDHVQYDFFYRVKLPASSGPLTLSLIDTNFPGERGFRRLALKGAGGVQVLESSVAPILIRVPRIPNWEMTPEQEEASGRLTARVQRPNSAQPPSTLATTEPAPAAHTGNPSNDPAAASTAANPPGTLERSLRELLLPQTSFAVVLALAYVLGMAHAVKPGHGKTLVAAYLVGQQGTIYHACVLGLVTALTHTGTVLFVALLLQPLAGSHWVSQDSISFWLTLISGVLVAWLGAALLIRRLRGDEDLLHVHGPGGHVHLPDGTVEYLEGGSAHAHHHAHAEDHSHVHPHEAGSIRTSNLLALGFSGGLIPCDDAVLLLLGAIGAGLLPQAIYILLAFSAGLASVLVLLGILVVKIKGFARQRSGSARLLQVVQIASAVLITVIGLALCYRAFFPPLSA